MVRRFTLTSRPALFCALAALVAACPDAFAQTPEGGQVRQGNAGIESRPDRTVVRQSSERAIIDWRRFDVGRDHSVEFRQPGASSATLNRVKGGGPSTIAGRISAPGTVIVQNEAGVLFTRDARIDVGGLVATAGRVDPAAFARGGAFRIEGGGAAGARVVNEGAITIGEAGLGALVGREVENHGAIVARKGTVALASGTRTTIDLAGDGIARIAVEGGEAGARVEQSGRIEVGDGRVVLSAGAASAALDGVINMSGIVRAGGAVASGGSIELTAGGAVRIDGSLDASGARRGGEVAVTGDRVTLGAGARVAASGSEAGGRVRIGGDLSGTGPMPRARNLDMARGAEVVADGGRGTGGTVILWADDETRVDGRLSAAGAGGGGFVETSARDRLAIGPAAEVLVGEGGRWLLDPRDMVIVPGDPGGTSPGRVTPSTGSGTFTVASGPILRALDAGSDVSMRTEAQSVGAAGDVTIAAPMVWTGSGSLDVQAVGAIHVHDTVISAGDGGITLTAGRGVDIRDVVMALGAGPVRIFANRGDITLTESRAADLVVATVTGALDFEARRGSIVMRRGSAAADRSIQVYSEAGPVRLAAAEAIEIEGGAVGGAWARVGLDTSAAGVLLEADRIAVRGGSAPNTFAEILSGPGGGIRMEARDITVQSGLDQALVQAFGGSPLTMLAETQLWNGPVRAGTGAGIGTGGEVRLAGAIVAGHQPTFALAPDKSFRLEDRTPGGAPSSYASVEPFVVTTAGSGGIIVEAPVSARRMTLVSSALVQLGPRARLSASDAGNALVVAAGARFENGPGPDAFALSNAAARWLLYLDNFDGLVGPAPSGAEFDLYNRPYARTPPAAVAFPGNRIVYGAQPVLELVASSGRKTYGTAFAPGFVVRGLRPGDSLGTALTAPPVAASAGSAPEADAGSYATTVAATASAQGYLLERVAGTLVVDPAPLTIVAEDARRTYGGADPAFGVRGEGFVLGQGLGDLGGSLVFASDAEAASPVGGYALRPSGLTSGNYAIAFESGTLVVDPAPLRIVAEDARRTYGGADPDFRVRGEGFVLGEGLGDLGGNLVFASDAAAASPVGQYALRPSGLTSANYAIAFEAGAFTIEPAALRVVAEDATRPAGSANPPFAVRYEGFVLGEDDRVLSGTLVVTTEAAGDSAEGTFRLTPSGLTSANYAIGFVDGILTVTAPVVAPPVVTPPGVTPPVPGLPPVGPQPPAPGPAPGIPGSGGSQPGPAPGGPGSGGTGSGGSGTPGGGPAGPGPVPGGGDGPVAGQPTPGPGPTPAPIPGPPPGPELPALPGSPILRDAAAIAGFDPARRGVAPLTPGDASFRTTIAEAPPALSQPFVLTYSLGEVNALTPGAGGFLPAGGGSGALAGAEGFVPAAGGIGTGEAAEGEGGDSTACRGTVRLPGSETCAVVPLRESFWTTREEGLP
jgi:filamentous hemagglutinin family protein